MWRRLIKQLFSQRCLKSLFSSFYSPCLPPHLQPCMLHTSFFCIPWKVEKLWTVQLWKGCYNPDHNIMCEGYRCHVVKAKMMHVGECSIIGTSWTLLFLNPECFFQFRRICYFEYTWYILVWKKANIKYTLLLQRMKTSTSCWLRWTTWASFSFCVY